MQQEEKNMTSKEITQLLERKIIIIPYIIIEECLSKEK